MPIDVGTNKIGKINVGSSAIGKVYIGSELVYQKQTGIRLYGFRLQDNSGYMYLLGEYSLNGYTCLEFENLRGSNKLLIKKINGTLGTSGSSIDMYASENGNTTSGLSYKYTINDFGIPLYVYSLRNGWFEDFAAVIQGSNINSPVIYSFGDFAHPTNLTSESITSNTVTAARDATLDVTISTQDIFPA